MCRSSYGACTMCRFALAPLLLLTALAARAQKPAQPTKDAVKPVTVEQLEQSLTETQGGADAELAQSLMRLELTERLSARRFTHLKEALPGEKSAQALLILTDRSEFLNPPKDEIVDQPVPDVAATRAMLVAIVNYVNTTQRQLPNLMATRETTGFEDRPAQDSLESTGIVSMSAMPLHQIASSTRVVTYRDRKEIVDEKASKGMKQGAPVEGLVTSGEFGPILSTVVADALKGAITWAHWEEGAAERNAVFHFSVPEGKSNYFVKFCCYVDGYQAGGEPELAVYNERAAYHGDITFSPADGSILRVSLQAEMPPTGLVASAGIVIEYSEVEIGGKTYICPSRSVSLLQAHVGQQNPMFAKSNYRGPAKTFLNNVQFKQFRRFGSETRILTSDVEPAPK